MRLMRGGLALVALLLAFVFPMVALAECGPEDPSCAFLPPQSVEVNPAPESGEGESVELGDPGVFSPLQIGVPMPAPAKLTPVPFPDSSSGGSHAPGDDEILDVPMRYQGAGDVTCGVQALGMAMDGLGPSPGLRTGGDGAASSAILSFLRDNGMMPALAG